jgi:long-chain fatty acid transport protein
MNAETVLATNGYQLIGVGQLQKSMAGAVTAAPMDTMTAISNPAGMARVGERADFSLEAFMPVRSVDFTGMGGTKTEGGSELYPVPSVGWVAKAFNRDKVYFGGGMFATSGLGVDYGEVLMMPGAVLDSATCTVAPCSDVTFDGYSAIQFWKMAPTVAWNVNDHTSFGVALNVDYQAVTIRERLRNVPFGPDTGPYFQDDVNLDLGRPTNQLGIGATSGFFMI